MAAPRALQQCRAFTRRPYGSAADPLKGGILQYLCNRFYDIEYLIDWSTKRHYKNLQRKNTYYGYTKHMHGDNIAAAYFVLSHRGRVRFQSQETWLCVDQRGKFSFDFLQFRDVPVVAIDLAGSVLTYDGLNNLVKLTALKSLDLSRCPHVDDWTLSRLHVFKDSLEELSLAGCPQGCGGLPRACAAKVGGCSPGAPGWGERRVLPTWELTPGSVKGARGNGHCTSAHLFPPRHAGALRLRRLDLSLLPSVPTPGLTRILVEEMLPQCEVVGLGHGDGLAPASGAQTSRDGKEEPGVPSGDRRAGEIPA
ncbi:protein shisa-6-like protein [Platysternon megacephalum]|uniref:Protein shisa-6-like protein n=1 Tax=Platysternon megacephalum TaxID=55544 RepID=A0A4D9DX06_9SAUR|nr:protein shisa-6-like protein [Platysternon megacephalum]